MPATAVTSEPGVYVSPSLLEQLERDKRSLKWQLSQATKAADARAAQLAACEDKVKDLMTIVEMNKTVADRAVKRNYTKECVVQRLHKERVRLQTYVESQQISVLSAIQRRRVLDTKRELFQRWMKETESRRKRRIAITRLLRIRRRRWLQEGWRQWVRILSTAPAAIHPLMYRADHAIEIPAKPPRPTVRFAVPPSPSTSFISEPSSTSVAVIGPNGSSHASHSHKTLSFATWKAQWLARKRRHSTALHFARLMLVKRVLAAWKQVIRRRNWRESMIQSAFQRRMYRCFVSWRAWAKRRRKTLRVLATIVSRMSRRMLMRWFTKLRVKCLEKCLVDWTDVLKDAREAVDEERKIYELHQSEAMLELQAQASHQHQQQKLFIDAQLQALDRRRRHERLRQCMAQWQRSVAFRALQTRVAAQFRRFRGLRSLTRRVFSAWRQRTRHQQLITKSTHRLRKRTTALLLSRVFRVFAHETKMLAARKRSLRRLCTKTCRYAKASALWRWRLVVGVVNEQATADLLQRELTHRLEIRETSWQSEAQRVRRVAYRYQLQCALSLGDARRERRMRSVWMAWKKRVKLGHERRIALKRLLKRKAAKYKALALAVLHTIAEEHTFRVAKLNEISSRCRKRREAAVFYAWRGTCQQQLVESTRQSLQYFTLLLLRKRSDQHRARNAAMRLLLKLHVRLHWQRPAFDKWRRKSDFARLFAARQREKHNELMQRLWRRWTVRVASRNRRKRLQYEVIASKAEQQRTLEVVKSAWIAWRAITNQRRVGVHNVSLLYRLQQQSAKLKLQGRVWNAWTSLHRRELQQRCVLQRLTRRIQRRATSHAWRRWISAVDSHRGAHTGGVLTRRKLQHTLHQHHTQRYLRSLLQSWRRYTRETKRQRLFLKRWLYQRRQATTRLCFSHWRHDFVGRVRLGRGILRLLLENKRKAVLRLGVSTWRRECITQSLASNEQTASHLQLKAQERAAAWLRKAWASRDLRACFIAWQSYCLNCGRRRQALIRLSERVSAHQTRLAWAKWSKVARIWKRIRRLETIFERTQLRVAWARLLVVVGARQKQELATQQLVQVISKALLRSTWTQWKRCDRHLHVVLLTRMQTTSTSALEAFMERVGHRHFSTVTVMRVFTRWKAQTLYQHALRRRVVETLAKQDALGVRRCFHAWTAFSTAQIQLKTLLYRITVRRMTGFQRQGFTKWKAFVVASSYEAKLQVTTQQLQQHREALARHVAMTMFTRWQKPTLTAVLRGWRSQVEIKSRLVNDAVSRCQQRYVRSAWAAWRSETYRRRSIKQIVRKLLMKSQRRALTEAWGVWVSWQSRVETVEDTLSRLLSSLRYRILKTAWRSLREYQDVVMRRQSMMVVVSAQTQLQRQKDLHKLRKVTFALQHRHKSTARQLFGAWRSYTLARRQRQTMKASIKRRYQRRVTRTVMRAWRAIVKQHQRVTKWQQTVCQTRAMRRMWCCWKEYLTRRRQATLFVWELLETQRVDALLSAWRSWKCVVELEARAQESREASKWRRASMAQQTHVASLETKTELLLLESVELKRTMQAQRQRCVEAFLGRVAGVVDAVWTRRVRSAWRQWAFVMEQCRAAQWVMKTLCMAKTRDAFVLWKKDTQEHKWTQHETVVMDKMAVILSGSSAQMCKKTAWRQWRAFATQRKQQRIMETLRRRMRDRAVKKSVFSGWKMAVSESHRRDDYIDLLLRQRRLRVARQVLVAWWRWLEYVKAQREGVLMLLRIERAIARRCVMQCWLRWRISTAEATVVMAKTKVVLMELEEMERATSGDESNAMRVFTAWREAVSQRRHLTEILGRQLRSHHSKARARRALREWRAVVAERVAVKKLKIQPVLCIRLPFSQRTKKLIATATKRPPGLCSYADFTKQRQGLSCWRVQLMKRVSQKRVRRLLGVVWLVRCLKRQQQHELRRAFWRWFSKIQGISSALQAIDFDDTLPWRRAHVDYASSMLLLVLEEMDLARQIHRNEKTLQVWRVVDAIAKAQQRQALRRGFDRWRWANPTGKRSVQSSRWISTGSSTSSSMAVKARACVGHLARVLLLRGFTAWKTQYIQLALQQAQAEQSTLLQALAQTTAYRQTIDRHHPGRDRQHVE